MYRDDFIMEFSRVVAPTLGVPADRLHTLGGRVANGLGLRNDDDDVLLVYMTTGEEPVLSINVPPLGGNYDLNMTWREYLEKYAGFGWDYAVDERILDDMDLPRFELDELCCQRFLKACWDWSLCPEAQTCSYFYWVDFQERKPPTDEELKKNPNLDEEDWGRVEIVESQAPGSNDRFVCVVAHDPVDYLSREFYRLGIKAIIKVWDG